MANIEVRQNDPPKPQTPQLAHEPEWDLARRFEVEEKKDRWLFKADVPGLKKEDIEVDVASNRLTIKGKREAEKEEKNDTYYAYERSYGSFTRAFTLPEGIDANAIHADLRDGILVIDVPKKSKEPKA